MKASARFLGVGRGRSVQTTPADYTVTTHPRQPRAPCPTLPPHPYYFYNTVPYLEIRPPRRSTALRAPGIPGVSPFQFQFHSNRRRVLASSFLERLRQSGFITPCALALPLAPRQLPLLRRRRASQAEAAHYYWARARRGRCSDNTVLLLLGTSTG